MVAYNPDPILPQVRLGRSWDFASVAVWDCENRFGVRWNGGRGLQSGPDSVIDDETGISRGDGRCRQNPPLSVCRVDRGLPEEEEISTGWEPTSCSVAGLPV